MANKKSARPSNSTNNDHKNLKKKKNSVANLIMSVVMVVAICIFLYSGYNLLHIYLEYKKGTDEYNKIAELAIKSKTPEPKKENKKQTDDVKPPFKIDFAALQKVNPDVIGWIYMDSIPDINYPIVKGTDNEKYLHTTYQGTYNFAGTLFIDYTNDRDFQDANTIIYGHNMKNGSMFGQLHKISQNPQMIKDHPYFWILTPKEDYRYQIFSCFTAAVDGEAYTMFKEPNQNFIQYLEHMKSYSDVPTLPHDIKETDKIVTLSTCTGNETTRYVVQGILVNKVPPIK